MLGGQDTVCTSPANHLNAVLRLHILISHIHSGSCISSKYTFPCRKLQMHIVFPLLASQAYRSPPFFQSICSQLLGVTSRKVLNSSKPGQCSKALRLAGRQVPLGQHLQPWSMDMQSKRSPFWMLLPLHKAQRCPTSDPFSHKPHTEP